MDKKYKLVIPDMVDKKYAVLVTLILAYDRCILNSDCFSWNVDSLYRDGCKCPIPKEWLQEVKGPMTFDEWFNYNLKESLVSKSESSSTAWAWESAIKNYKLELKEIINKKIKQEGVNGPDYTNGLYSVLDILEED